MPPKPKTKNDPIPGATAMPVAEVIGSPGNAAAAITNYAEIQGNEIEALRSIYMVDFRDLESKPTAWNRPAEKAFSLLLKAPSDEEVNLTLTVDLPSTYPKSLPKLKVDGVENLRSSTKKKVLKIVSDVPKSLVGQEMIFDIASQIADVLDEAAQARAKNPGLSSLQEERQVQEAELRLNAQKAEQQFQDEEQEKMHRRADDLQIILDDKMKARQAQERHLEGLDGINLDDEVAAFNAAHPGLHRYAGYTGIDHAMDEFDYVMANQNSKGRTFNFRKVSRAQILSDKPYKSVFRVVPITKNVPHAGTLVLTQIQCRNTDLASSLTKRMELEELLDRVKSFNHHSIARLFNFKLSQIELPETPEVKLVITTLMEDANYGSLKELLMTMGGDIQGHMVREYFAQLAEGMEYYEQSGVVHPGLSLKNILVFFSGGSISLKISHGYAEALSGPPPSDKATSDPQLPYWTPPETLKVNGGRNLKTAIYELGVVFLQMSVGMDIKSRFTSFTDLIQEIYLKPIFQNTVHEMMYPDHRLRIRAFKVITSGLLQSYGPLVELDPLRDFSDPSEATPEAIRERLERVRRDSFHAIGNQTRYARDFNEVKLLGKGGFGEVVKTRNKLDNQFYAVKKIVSNSEDALSEIIPEIVLLSRINSLHVVRYIAAWIEKEDVIDAEDETTTSGFGTEPAGTGTGTGAFDPFSDIPSSRHDFMSSSNLDNIEFALDTDDEDIEDGGDETSDESESEEDLPDVKTFAFQRGRQRRDSTPQKYILYIQMEFCEKNTLKQLIEGGLWNDVSECWRLFRHIIDGLTYIHGAGIIHRDLKPENIFMDKMNVARIGDFGLATTGQFASVTGTGIRNKGTEMDTTSIGTRHYIAPEVAASRLGQYTTKVDMYALGIILFEMSVELKTSHERDQQLSAIRHKHHTLPPIFQKPDKIVQGDVILELITHEPEARPSASELVERKDMPWSDDEDELTKLLAQPDSLEYKRFVDIQFKQEATQVQDHLWDRLSQTSVTPEYLLMAQKARETLTEIFKRHGAYCIDAEEVFPASAHYDDAAKILDPSGLVLQLPYDLTLANARLLARHDHGLPKTFSFGNVYRQTTRGGRPLQMDEADFDIISRNTGNFALKEAEVLKVLDEISYAFPQLRSQSWAIHINHADLLDLIFEYCRIPKQKWALVKQHLANLNLPNNTWSRIKADLRDPRFNLSSSALDELGRFNITGTLAHTREAIESILTNTQQVNRLPQIFSRLSAIFTYNQRFKVKRPVLHNPLACYSENLYKGSILFQLIIDAKKRRIVWAVGGRYDRLIEEFMIKRSPSQPRAVGFHLNIEEIYRALVKAEEAKAANKRGNKNHTLEEAKPKRTDVLITSFDPEILHTSGIEVLQNLWEHDISADLAAMDDLDEPHSWTIVIRQDTSAVGERSYKIRSSQKREEVDVSASDLVNYIKNELRLRDNITGGNEPPSLLRQPSRPDTNITTASGGTSEREIQVLTPQHRSKKTNRRNIIDAAIAGARDLAFQSADEAPIAAIELTSDHVLECLRETRLSDPESWRTFLQSAPLTEQKYLGQLHEMLKEWAGQGRRAAWVFNYRTKACVFYDLGKGVN
ncbi:putative protein kinase [Phaeomoniella chlamydospora]|uniref:non-specific serine/threonine protein kinase n=1 Tax=Phaeomoniella chlamydospora TaxID=158046 RepID=A0A0G2ESX2_PHACM|nr:putative protein kinase [Phaeomoniella chlamydospora]